MDAERKQQELRAWFELCADQGLRSSTESVSYLGILMARLNGMVNTGVISWEEWRELKGEVESQLGIAS